MSLLLLVSLFGAEPQALPKPDASVLDEQNRRVAMIKRITPAVVAVFGKDDAGGGSGVLISNDGYVLTNFHVVRGSGMAMKAGLPDGKVYDAVLVGIDPVGDVAMIKLLGSDDFPVATIGDSDRLRLGETVYAVGNPFLLATDFQPTVTAGIVSGLQRYQYPAGTLLEYADCIQTDAAINPGNSGGPLFNDAGELVGINGRGQFEKRGRVSVGVGFAISINQIKHFLDHLRGGLIIDHATLGATVTSDAEGRVVVDNILSSSDAYRQGLDVGDEIVRFGGRAIASVNDFKNVLGIYPSGWTVELTYRRDDRKETIHPRLVGVHGPGQLEEMIAPKEKPTPDGHPEIAPDKTDVPEKARPFIEEKPGFANEYFNRLQRERLLAGLRQKMARPDDTKTWRLTLLDQKLAEAKLLLDDKAALWDSPQRSDAIEHGRDAVRGDGLVGLLVALDQWRGLLINPERWFEDATFVGGYPSGDGARWLAIRTDHAGIVTTWYFDRHTQLLRAFECEIDPELAPVRVSLDNYRSLEGKLFPHDWRLEISSGPLGEFRVKEVTFDVK
ncbi:Periplasmic serine endoprotease DegP precursor [Planctomycetes bacterium Pan216]|uniref:Periplasmic serine endoprotease DegP n=1 Tax=Kolteria novifilia TaxID=2527975 RepID=A0A518B2A4_9BACT|nr:Periplasmic serine endoprotease DegP precursor [Planctomycetes bacterium Pan216]